MSTDNTTDPARVLFARGLCDDVILATDSRAVALEVEAINDRVDEVLDDWFAPDAISLYLFDGSGIWTAHGGLDGSCWRQVAASYP